MQASQQAAESEVYVKGWKKRGAMYVSTSPQYYPVSAPPSGDGSDIYVKVGPMRVRVRVCVSVDTCSLVCARFLLVVLVVLVLLSLSFLFPSLTTHAPLLTDTGTDTDTDTQTQTQTHTHTRHTQHRHTPRLMAARVLLCPFRCGASAAPA